ncbi:MAG TPA: Coenzyme F420 hydrogenase/dehydrogenase, beta subunit C-terminal domain [Smithella sp.]|nr:Coenzyme F420 hydrogenase/dehydrogenase, beta subunit C-terminal domain [Smithella sp.]
MHINKNSKLNKSDQCETFSIKAIINNRVCCGCGTCTVVCPNSAITLNFGERFNYPVIDTSKCTLCQRCLEVCPSRFLLNGTKPDVDYQVASSNSTAYLIHAKDEILRRDAASGGFISGLFLYLLEHKKIDGCIVTRCEGDNPLVAETFIATDKQSIISASGSKYAPVSACIALKDVLQKPGKYAFVGTPCMLEGLAKLEKYLPELKEIIVLKIGFVCAGMASRLSTKNYIEHHGHVALKKVHKICYRGDGWPGRFRVFDDEHKLLMDEPHIGGSSMHIVGIDHYLRCYNCLDHWSHYGDIIVSDPWKEEMIHTEKLGRSAIMIKNEVGKNAVIPAIEDGFFTADSISIQDMIDYNKHLLILDNHETHSWMALYQLLFMRRFRYSLRLFKHVMERNLRGIMTTLKARLTKKYYY